MIYEVMTKMPYHLPTLINKLDSLENNSNALLIKEFYDLSVTLRRVDQYLLFIQTFLYTVFMNFIKL